ncbi:MAG TPA: ferredoxin family protein [Alphaproteobacteria bacterium]|nr:ferredoxin family protein [Alphaproteobacteria bacterium]
MPWVIGPLCTDRMDTAGVEVCPVDCIQRYTGEDPHIPKHQLLIDPEVCIDYGVCEPACPWEAIYQDTEVPEEFRPSIEINALIARQQEIESPRESKPQLTAQEVAANREQGWANFDDRLKARPEERDGLMMHFETPSGRMWTKHSSTAVETATRLTHGRDVRLRGRRRPWPGR